MSPARINNALRPLWPKVTQTQGAKETLLLIEIVDHMLDIGLEFHIREIDSGGVETIMQI
jgi:hypothetical protein